MSGVRYRTFASHAAMTLFINSEKVEVVAVSHMTLLYRQPNDHRQNPEQVSPPDNQPVLVETRNGEVLLCQRVYCKGLGAYKWIITGTESEIPASSIRSWWHY